MKNGQLNIYLNEENVTEKIRTKEVDNIVGKISKIKER